eukprot:121286_1
MSFSGQQQLLGSPIPPAHRPFPVLRKGKNVRDREAQLAVAARDALHLKEEIHELKRENKLLRGRLEMLQHAAAREHQRAHRRSLSVSPVRARSRLGGVSSPFTDRSEQTHAGLMTQRRQSVLSGGGSSELGRAGSSFSPTGGRILSQLEVDSDAEDTEQPAHRGSANQISAAMVSTMGKLLYQMKRMALADSRETLWAEAAKCLMAIVTCTGVTIYLVNHDRKRLESKVSVSYADYKQGYDAGLKEHASRIIPIGSHGVASETADTGDIRHHIDDSITTCFPVKRGKVIESVLEITRIRDDPLPKRDELLIEIFASFFAQVWPARCRSLDNRCCATGPSTTTWSCRSASLAAFSVRLFRF